MRRTSRIQALAAAGMALCLAAGAAHSQTVVYSSTFEAPLYSLGPIGDSHGAPLSGQDRWLASPREPYSAAPSPWVVVNDQRATSGTQSMSLRMDPSFFNGVNARGAEAARDFSNSPIVLNSPVDAFSVSMRLYLQQTAASDLGWALSLYTGGCCGLSVSFLPGGDKVGYGHNLMNQGQTFTPGFGLLNTWLTVRLERDPLDHTALLLSLGDGSQTWTQQLTSPGGAMPYFAISGLMPTFPVAPYGTAFVDDLVIGYNLAAAVPEPTPAILWLAGAAGLAGWMRRRLPGRA
jgi:hypothetical protein